MTDPVPHDLRAIARDVPLLRIGADTTRDDALATPMLGSWNGCELGVARFSGQPPWEKHAADELVYVIAGSIEIRLLTAAGPRDLTLTEGQLLVVPADTWHRSFAADEVTLLFGTPSEGNEHSFAEDPRA